MSENSSKPQLTPEQIQKLLTGMQSKPQATKPQQIMSRIINEIFHFMQTLVHYIDRFIKFIIKSDDIDRNDVVRSARGPIIFGTYVIIIFIVFGGLWSILAPLDSAAVAVGTVIPSSKRKLIQHHRGGIIKAIYVEQGQEIKEGDKIVELDETDSRTSYEATLNQYRILQANEDRLIAERDNATEIKFSEFLTKDSELPEVQKLIEGQIKLFNSKKEAYNSRIIALKQKHEQFNRELESLSAKKASTLKAAAFHKNQEQALKELFAKGYVQKSKIMEVEANAASSTAELSNIDIQIAKTKQAMAQDESEILSFQSDYMSKVLQELTERQGQKAEAKERYLQAKDNLERVIIYSPVEGTIIDLSVHTIGGVIGGGYTIAEIMPKNDNLIIEAKVPSKEIDAIKVGLEAKIRFSAFKSRTSPVFLGKVVSLSPDIVQDRQAAQQMSPMMAGDASFYIARIELDMDYFNKVSKERGLVLRPGMQAEVQIVRGTRTLFRYLLDPVTDNMFKAFKEK